MPEFPDDGAESLVYLRQGVHPLQGFFGPRLEPAQRLPAQEAVPGRARQVLVEPVEDLLEVEIPLPAPALPVATIRQTPDDPGAMAAVDETLQKDVSGVHGTPRSLTGPRPASTPAARPPAARPNT